MLYVSVRKNIKDNKKSSEIKEAPHFFSFLMIAPLCPQNAPILWEEYSLSRGRALEGGSDELNPIPIHHF